jgi:uncharacterized membrane protein YphA (DoxX/SURF4 family)
MTRIPSTTPDALDGRRPWTGADLLMLGARLTLGVLFIYMGMSKALEPIEFLKAVREYRMIPEQPPILLNLTAAVLPWLEVVCGLLLVLGIALRGNALLLLTLLIGFTAIITARALHIHNTQGIAFCAIKFDCGCGVGEEWICHKLPQNLGLIVLSIIVLVSRSRRWCLRGELFGTDRHTTRATKA